MKRVSLLLCLIAVATLSPVRTDAMTCYYGSVEEGDGYCCETYHTSRLANIPGYGDACAYSGQGCTECFDIQQGGSCTTSGTYCSYREPLNRY